MMFDASNSMNGGRGEIQSGGPEQRPFNSLRPCIWYQMLCMKCGECYAALESPVDSLKCPQCKQDVSVQFLCKGLTVATLPHFSNMRRWVNSHGSKTLEQRTNFVQDDPQLRRQRDLYYRVDYTIAKEQQYQDREVRPVNRG